MIITLSTATLGCALLTVGTNIPMIAIGVILAGAGINSSSGIVFYFLGETVENIKRQKYSIVVQTAYTFGSILVTSSYYLFHNWRIVVILLQTIPVVITLFFFVIYIEETPQFLLKGSN
jgi:MFS family permease